MFVGMLYILGCLVSLLVRCWFVGGGWLFVRGCGLCSCGFGLCGGCVSVSVLGICG